MPKYDKNEFTEAKIKRKRTFPTANTVVSIILVLVQIGLIVGAICVRMFYDPTPQDIIKNYTVTVEPQENGSLDIEYRFLWNAIDTSEELTWVEIGMANNAYTVYDTSVSDNIKNYVKSNSDGYTTLVLHFEQAYKGNETFEFSFKINQKNMLCKDASGYFYEFVPGWFNATPVESYEFKWKKVDVIPTENLDSEKEYFVWSGSFDCGEYQMMTVRYPNNAFLSANTVEYEKFDSSGAYNELKDEKNALVATMIVAALLIIIAEVYIADSFVSYKRGRGFLTGYGHRIHLYGRTNPRYIRARNSHFTGSGNVRGGRGGGGGCACACACACAGGGRAGCSQKDTFGNIKE